MDTREFIERVNAGLRSIYELDQNIHVDYLIIKHDFENTDLMALGSISNIPIIHSYWPTMPEYDEKNFNITLGFEQYNSCKILDNKIYLAIHYFQRKFIEYDYVEPKQK